jgi:hypothetical protein
MKKSVLCICMTVCVLFTMAQTEYPKGFYMTKSSLVNRTPTLAIKGGVEVKENRSGRSKLRSKDLGLDKEVTMYGLKFEEKKVRKGMKETPPLLYSTGKDIYINMSMVKPKTAKILKIAALASGSISHDNVYTKVFENGKNLLFLLGGITTDLSKGAGASGGTGVTATASVGVSAGPDGFYGVGIIDSNTGKLTRIVDKYDVETLLENHSDLLAQYEGAKRKSSITTIYYFVMQYNKRIQ